MNFDPKNYVVSEQNSIRDALTKIQKNKLGMVCVASKSQQIIGLSTDGDIRLGLLAGLNLDESISQWADRTGWGANEFEENVYEEMMEQYRTFVQKCEEGDDYGSDYALDA